MDWRVTNVPRASSALDRSTRWPSSSRQEYCVTDRPSGRSTASISDRSATDACFRTYPSESSTGPTVLGCAMSGF